MHSLLTQTTASTFEDLAFLCPTGEPDDAQRAQPLSVAVVVSFSGAVLGELVLELTPALLPEIAASMLGDGGDISLQVQNDALGEIANVICGNIVPSVAGVRAVIALSAPRIVDATHLKRGAAQAETELGVSGGRVRARLFVYSLTDVAGAA
jgi:CheY-specific phosphatase CheX